MELFFRKSGSGDPIIVLHGLYGSSGNWYSIARELSSELTVYLVDQRNHGNSPHHPEHNYEVMCEDLNMFMQQHGIDKSVILGHSMGGKTALTFGLRYPHKVSKMIVVDISPLGYSSQRNSPESVIHERIINALLSIHPDQIKDREEADQRLKKTIAPPQIRQFLLKNLKRNPEGMFYWALNIHTIADNLPAMFASVIPDDISIKQDLPRFPLLFMKGEYSAYIRSRDKEAIRLYFPWAKIEIIAGAGHWIHAEQPAAFLNSLRAFLHG